MTPEQRNLKIIIALSVIGIAISGYLLYTKITGYQSFCDFSPEVSCDAVNQSPYSEFPANSGIPISGLGIAAFLIFLTPAALLLRSRKAKNIISGLGKVRMYELMFLWGAFSLLFYVYLTYLELYVIYAICPLCVVTFIITIGIFLLIVSNLRALKGGRK
jgi:uncharacterized membrane protein